MGYLQTVTSQATAAVIGAGPAGLMAAEILCASGVRVTIYDRMAMPARKFLRAGIGGLNLTHSEPLDQFISRFAARAPLFSRWLREFGPEQQRAWAADLGIKTFIGSSGRVFPTSFKAAPMLRAWLKRLSLMGASLHTRHLWQGWDDMGNLRFQTPDGDVSVQADGVVLALGGASWPQLGSDGSWSQVLTGQGGAHIAPFQPANCGFDVDWSEHFKTRFAGHPVKAVGLSHAGRRQKGEFVITETGVEGSTIYALSAQLRDEISAQGQARLDLDLKPDWSLDKLAEALDRPRGSRSLANHLDRNVGLKGVAAGLLREATPGPLPTDSRALALMIKSVPLILRRPRPLAEAISTAGGVTFESLTDSLMLTARPGVFLAGEMLDWEAPTGGYLLTGCLATGRQAGMAAAQWMATHAVMPSHHGWNA